MELVIGSIELLRNIRIKLKITDATMNTILLKEILLKSSFEANNET